MNKEDVINGIKERLFNNCELRPSEVLVLKDYINQLETSIATKDSELLQLKEESRQLKTNINTAIEFIDQVLQYHLSPFDYKQVDEDINTLIGILRSDSNE